MQENIYYFTINIKPDLWLYKRINKINIINIYSY